MRRFSIAIPLLVVMLVSLVVVGRSSLTTLAQEATPTGAVGTLLPPDAQVAGLSLAEWSARSWQWIFSFPEEVNPFSDETGARCGYGQAGPVFFLAGAERSAERACIVPSGVHVLVPLLGSECSTVEPPPFFGRDEAELRRCATEAVAMAETTQDMTTMQLSVDGQSVDDLSAYRTNTPRFPLWLPEDNLLGSSQRVADSVADGYLVLLSPLAEGEHVVAITIPGPETVTITYRLTVVSGAYATPSASPEASPTG